MVTGICTSSYDSQKGPQKEKRALIVYVESKNNVEYFDEQEKP